MNPILVYRLLLYVGFAIGYVLFTALHMSNSVGWAEYHAYRVFNSVEYLRLNGYLASYGFSIWSSCINCSLSRDGWVDQIYLSGSTLLTFWPYLTVNHFFWSENLLIVGPIIDKTVIFISAVLAAELFIRFVRSSHMSKGSISLEKQSPPVIIP